MKISLIIPAYNEEKYIGTCLEAVERNAHGKFHEILVIDNASIDKTAEIAQKYSGVKVIHESKKGLTKARQKGLEESTGDILAYIDADTKMPEGWAEKIEKEFETNSKLVSLSGPYKYYDGSLFEKIIMTALWWTSAPITYRLVGFMLLGGNFAAKKESLVAMGGFDSSIEFYGEDTDIARRLHKFGKVVFKMNFYMYTSMRRISKEGIFKANIAYGINFLWEVLFKKPFTQEHRDIREIIR
jgi:glycosyltransferase involved in cell wall biosynthesis